MGDCEQDSFKVHRQRESEHVKAQYRARYQEKLKAIPGASGQLTQYEHPVLVTVIDTFKEVLTQLAVDLSELNYESQAEIDPRKPIQMDERPAQAKKKKPRASSKKPK